MMEALLAELETNEKNAVSNLVLSNLWQAQFWGLERKEHTFFDMYFFGDTKYVPF